jgi:predicted TPR repeat methyltransferase
MHSTETGQPPVELTLAEVLSGAVQLHRRGHINEAEELYRRVLEVHPEQPDALGFLGMVSMHRGRIDEAIELIARALAIEPGNADRYNNLGNVLLAAERVDDAADAYRKAIELAPLHANAHNNLGIIYRAQRRYDEATRAYARAIEIDGGHVEAYNNYGNLLSVQGRMREAINAYSKALTLSPRDTNARKYLAVAHAALGELDKAAAIYREWLEQQPDHAGAQHLLAACSGENVPERAADAYIETTFDSFSRSFDAHLAKLEYRAPELIAGALAAVRPLAEKRLVVLDAGCGTGLCGPLIAPYAVRLDGVDLSSGMLEKARARSVYDELLKAELTSHLHSVHETYDLVVSADTLVYFGVLDDVLPAASQALRPGGLLIFTVEHADEADAPQGHRLNPHGRYSHTRDYLERTLGSAGFNEVSIGTGVLRQERGEAVAGLVVTARKAAPPVRAARAQHQAR